MTDLVINKDEQSTPNTSIPFSDSGQYVTLAATGSANIAVPAGMSLAMIQVTPGATVLVDTNTISYTSSTSFQAGTFDINPAVRDVVGGTDTLYFYAVDAAIIKISFYRR